jgi:predicted dehydrogenase
VSGDKIRIGVIGAGAFVCRRHLPAILKSPDAEIAAICRRNPEALNKIGETFEVPESRRYTEWEDLLSRDDLDAVLIATPHALHYEPAKAALNRGLHLLLEKPMTVKHSDALELLDLAAAKKLQLGVALNPPFWSHCHRMRERIRSGELGEVESVSVYWSGSAAFAFGKAPMPANLPGVVPPTYYRADPELNGGGYFIDGGSHLVSEVLWVTGLRPKRVFSLMDSLPTDMRCSLAIELENGAMATINAIGDSKYASRRVHNTFGFTAGEIRVNDFAFNTEIHRPGEEVEQFAEADMERVSEPIPNFIDAILGRDALYSSGSHGADVVSVIEAAYRAQETGAAQVLPWRS